MTAGRGRTAIAVWRAWHGTAHVALGGSGLILLHLWSGPVEVPGRDDVAQITWPLVPTLLALACLTGARSAHRPGERTTVRGASVVRAGYVAAVALLAAVLLTGSGPTADPWMLARNDALMCGLALLAAERLRPSAAWAPLVLVPMLTWLLGSNGLGVAPEPWAVLLAPAGSPTARASALLVLAAGIAVYVGRPLLADVRRAQLRQRTVSGARSGR